VAASSRADARSVLVFGTPSRAAAPSGAGAVPSPLLLAAGAVDGEAPPGEPLQRRARAATEGRHGFDFQ